MRRNMLMLLAAALLVVTGCKKDDKTTEGEKMTFNAGFDKGGAKTEINGYDLSWKQNDAVSINGSIFTAQNDGPTTTLVGDEVEKIDGLYKAYYPAGIYNGGTPTLPSIQTYSGNDLSGVNPMYAQGSTTDLTFSNICAVLKLQLTSTVEKTVSEIRVTSRNPLSGEFEIAEDGGSFKAVMKSNASNAGVTLSCDGVSLTSTPSVLYVTLPEGDYSEYDNLQFQVVASDGQVASFKVAASLKANMLYDVERILEFSQPLPSSWTNGKNPHPFTVGMDGEKPRIVYFSQGNLQYIGSTGTWKFADHQFDFLGNNGQGSTSQTADRDLFGWGSTGNAPTGDSYYVNYQPWATSTSTVDPTYNIYGYGPSTNRPHPTGGVDERDLLVSNGSDWGANAISNGGGSSWRTLTMDEWVYLIKTRKDGSGNLLYGEGMVGSCTPGLIILPDGWSCPSGVTDVSRGTSSWSNVYSYSQWAQLEAAGAVFLPAAGYRNGGTTVNYAGSDGYYWSSSYNDSYSAIYFYFDSYDVIPGFGNNRYRGMSVRLVSDN